MARFRLGHWRPPPSPEVWISVPIGTNIVKSKVSSIALLLVATNAYAASVATPTASAPPSEPRKLASWYIPGGPKGAPNDVAEIAKRNGLYIGPAQGWYWKDGLWFAPPKAAQH